MVSKQVRRALLASQIHRQQNELELWTTLAAGNFAPRVDFPAGYSPYWDFNGQIYPATSGAAISAPAVGGMQRAVLKGVPLSQLTRLDANSTGLVGDITNLRPDRFRAMQYLYLHSTSVSGDISGWVLPSTMRDLRLYLTSVSGDISGWVLPSSMQSLYLYSTSVSGDISGWVLPSTMQILAMYSTSVSGDISGWVLPSTMQILSLYSTSVSGDISGWVLPSTMRDLSLASTSVSGDISGWVLPSSMQILSLSSTSVRVLATFAGVGTGMRDFRIYSCSLPAGDVGNIITSIWTVRAGFTYATPSLQIGGNNAAPGGNVVAPPGDGASDSDWYWNAGTGKYEPLTAGAMIWDLAKDVNSEGFKKWAITYNGGSI